MGWWKADPAPSEEKPSLTTTSPSSASTTTPVAPHPISPSDSSSSCPIDPKARSVWLQAARSKQQSSKTPGSNPPPNPPPQPTTGHSVAPSSAASKECSSDRIDQLPPSQSLQTQTPVYKQGEFRQPLSTDREISSIPRGYPMNQTPAPSQQQQTTPTSSHSSPAPRPRHPPASSLPSNSESETGHDRPTGNWIYPSESQFFRAVMQKQTLSSSDPRELASSISSIIPIHNAVNERAWHMIRDWEGGSSAACGGPKLLRFEGKGAGAKSPRAVMKSWSGYTEPFDRHDWVVQRCDGTEVEYVIDFYQGRARQGQGLDSGEGGGGIGAGLNFYLDVRPKLNSLEGWKMRFERAAGWR